MRANFGLMKELAGVLHKNGSTRIAETRALMDEISSQQKVQDYMSGWGMQFDT